ncbi:MAG: LUD domain-containing protein [Desulfitobacteriaceae bacterium]|nr:LUD domain-containing protein [Desulfitobacteriaceae bacterium]
MAKKEFKSQIKKALDDPLLRNALGRFGETYPQSRENIFEGVSFPELREKMKAVKIEALSQIDELAAGFKEQAEARGAVVFPAKTGEEALQYIWELAQKHRVKTIVKSKSMASEEIHLNKFLIDRGVEVVETDLGEWIIQQAGQKPSHMVMPAIHMSKEQVAELFTKSLGKEVPAEIPKLVKVARGELRRKFLAAEMGISGANIAVAETGTMVIFTNEGNGRLTATLPPIHVVLVGYEKLVPRFSDIDNVAQLLPRSATAQNITSYITMITGAVPTYQRETGELGKKELHIILLDNGRFDLAKDSVFREAYQCLRCGACLNVCPAYQLVGGHVYGHIYCGGIGSILTAFFHSYSDADNLQSLCMQCRRCVETCPGGIDIPKLVFELRRRLTEKRNLPFTQRFIFQQVLSNRRRFHSALRIAVKVQSPLTKGTPYIRHLPLLFSPLTEFRSLPALARKPFRDCFKEMEQKVKKPKGDIAFFAGCMIDFVYPEIGEAVVQFLNKKGFKAVFPEEQNCCGAPAAYSGDLETGKELARQNIEAFFSTEVKYIVSACPTCTDFLAKKYAEMFPDEPEWREKAEAIAKKTIDFVKLASILGTGKQTKPRGKKKGQVTYHTSCHLKRTMEIYDEPRKVLKEAGFDVIEMKETDNCCGLAGSYAVKFPEISAPILERKLNNIEETGVDLVAVDCPGCLLQLRGGLDKRNSRIKAKHTAQILAEGRA